MACTASRRKPSKRYSSTHIQGILDEKIPHFAPTEVDGRAPGSVHVFAEEAAGIAMQVIAVGTEVVVDHVENHRQTMTVGGVDQVFELVGRTIGEAWGA